LHGVEDMVEEGRNGFVVERTAEGFADGLRRLRALPAHDRRAMGERARTAVRRFGVEHFLRAWSNYYLGLEDMTSSSTRMARS
jgi:glycosyltransferase involved in cell wall biosynthesis